MNRWKGCMQGLPEGFRGLGFEVLSIHLSHLGVSGLALRV